LKPLKIIDEFVIYFAQVLELELLAICLMELMQLCHNRAHSMDSQTYRTKMLQPLPMLAYKRLAFNNGN
jgi:hypothetical protein